MYAPLSQRTPSDSTAETYVGGGERVDGEGKRTVNVQKKTVVVPWMLGKTSFVNI
jgi:hypothetical protein